MSARDAHEPAPPEIHLVEAALHFTRIASSVETGKPESSIMALMDETERLCHHAAVIHGDEAKELLPCLVTMLQTWRTVWQRMAGQQDFRLAVAREARVWSARVAELATRAGRLENGKAA